MCVGREEELPGAGAHRVLDIAGESIIVVRNQEGVLRGFYNVCRHRGTRLCHSAEVQARGPSEFRSGVVAGRRIVCPYHQWAYDLDGHLVAAPHLQY
jgi:Rieske 2Fe-2S family protein